VENQVNKLLINSGITILFLLASIWIVSLYFPNNQEAIIASMVQEKTKADDLYYNELAVNHPFVIMNTNSSLIQLKKKTNKLVLK
jgi:hypothetical protein